MPRCYPPGPAFGDGRHGERAVWTALREQLPDDAALFYSRWFTDQGREHEIDLLVAWPGGGTEAAGRATPSPSPGRSDGCQQFL